MADPTNSDLAHTLGVIQANQENLRREFERERDGASDHRRGLRETIAALSEAVRTLTAQMNDVFPLSTDYRTRRDQASGMAKIMWAAMIALGAVVGTVANKIIEHFK